MSPSTLPGFRDFYPAEFAIRSHITTCWRETARKYGFEEYDGPPLESLDLYTAKSGDEIVNQLYNFMDKGGRAVSLRPEMTPTLARMVGARAAEAVIATHVENAIGFCGLLRGVLPVEQAYRIRTGESGEETLQAHPDAATAVG